MAASDPLSADADAVAYLLLFHAVKALVNDGTFAPFGGVSTAEGNIETVEVGTGDDKPEAPEVLAYVEGMMLRDEVATGARAVASAVNVHATDKAGQRSNAICIHLELADGYVADLIQPYSMERLAGDDFSTMVLGDLFTIPSGTQRIFS